MNVAKNAFEKYIRSIVDLLQTALNLFILQFTVRQCAAKASSCCFWLQNYSVPLLQKRPVYQKTTVIRLEVRSPAIAQLFSRPVLPSLTAKICPYSCFLLQQFQSRVLTATHFACQLNTQISSEILHYRYLDPLCWYSSVLLLLYSLHPPSK